MRHTRSPETQTVVWVSSTDSWHRASDQDDDVEQPGLDLVFTLGLTQHLPMLTPVALLYGTPEDAFRSSVELMRAGAQMVELERRLRRAPLVVMRVRAATCRRA